MSTEGVQDDVQQHDSPQTEEAPPANESQETQGHEPDGQPEAQADGDAQPDGAHPLEPGGKRFNQVYARAKEAEHKLQAERERAARLEGELEATRRQATPKPEAPAEKRYTISQLQSYIDDGKITVGQALAYQEETLKQEVDRKLDAKLTERLAATNHQSTVQREINRYREAIPEVDQVGSPERTRLEQEFNYLIQMGYDKTDPRTEVLAARAAFGDPDIAKSKRQAKSIPARDTMQDITTNGSPKPAEKDPLKQLTSEQRKHYQRMIDRGVYKGWGEVKEELAYVPGR